MCFVSGNRFYFTNQSAIIGHTSLNISLDSGFVFSFICENEFFNPYQVSTQQIRDSLTLDLD